MGNMPVPRKRKRRPGEGAPLGNTNGLRHGRYSKKVIPAGGLPPGCESIHELMELMSKQLWKETQKLYGKKVTVLASATITTACRFETHAQLAQKWLRENPDLDVDMKVMISREIAKASAERDKCIRALGLPIGNAAGENIWSGIPALPAPADDDAGNGEHVINSDDEDPDNSREARRARLKARREAEAAGAAKAQAQPSDVILDVTDAKPA